MVGKIFITRTGYDPEVGRHIKDPYLGPCPTLGACRPDIRKQLQKGDHILVISGKVPRVNQFVMAAFEIDSKIHAMEAYERFPKLRLHKLPNGELDGNIIVDAKGNQHKLDNHNSFDERTQNYVIGTNLILLSTPGEIAEGRKQTIDALRDILQKQGDSPIEIVGRWGTKLTETQIIQLREWLEALKQAAKN